MKKVGLIMPGRTFRSAVGSVQRELKKHGFWDRKLSVVRVRQTAFGVAYGWQFYGGCCDIVIPSFSVCRLLDSVCGRYVALREVLRHEYAHALADTHRALVRVAGFSTAFGSSHDNPRTLPFDPRKHVTTYAATSASEDFAETFALYIKHGGRLPERFDLPPIVRKWKFIEQIPRKLAIAA